MRESKETLEATIAAVLARRFPEVELIDTEVRGGAEGTLTVFVDRPGGVDLDLCAAISGELEEVRERYSLEVSSPGLDRRLAKPAHFAAQVGREVAVKLKAPRDGRSNYRGRLSGADEATVTLEFSAGGGVTLPLASIAKAHVVYNFDSDGGHRE
ncbi:MAG: ribosome maturation factor RimP [Thermoleophilia bacterium]